MALDILLIFLSALIPVLDIRVEMVEFFRLVFEGPGDYAHEDMVTFQPPNVEKVGDDIEESSKKIIPENPPTCTYQVGVSTMPFFVYSQMMASLCKTSSMLDDGPDGSWEDTYQETHPSRG